MKNIYKQASRLLQRQTEQQDFDPLNNVRKEAVSHVLARVLDAEGFMIVITSTKDGKTDGLALAGGSIPKKEALEELLRAVESVGLKFGVELELQIKNCTCPKCEAKRKNQTFH